MNRCPDARGWAVNVIVGALALVTTTSHVLAQCGPGAGPCLEVHEGPGCDGIACCEAVCKLNPLCCEIEWDEFCVELAKEFCADIPCPGEGSCFEVHDGSGCDDEACCFLMCRFDSYCCFASWDEICVEEALELCDAVPCAITPPAEAVPEEELCEERLNDFCNVGTATAAAIECGMIIDGAASTGSPRDTDWYVLTLDAPQRLVWTVEAEFPAQLLVVTGVCDGALQTVGEAHGGNCQPASLDLCLGAGTWYLIVSTGFPGRNLNSGVPCPDDDPKTEPGLFGNRYVASLGCAGCGSAADLNGDGVVDGADLGLLLAQWGQDGAADLNGDGVVDGADLGLLLADWG